jgi:hypothetical protein
MLRRASRWQEQLQHISGCALAQHGPRCITTASRYVLVDAAVTSGRSYPGAGSHRIAQGVLLVVRGRKVLTLLPPSATRLLRPRAAHLHSANHSTLSNAELEELLGSTEGAAAAVRLEATAGDAVRIPAGWWHVVDSVGEDGEDVTIAVNWWWRSAGSRGVSEAEDAAAAPERADPAEAGGAGGSAFELRSAFAAAVRAEEQRMLHCAAGLDNGAPLGAPTVPPTVPPTAPPTATGGERLACGCGDDASAAASVALSLLDASGVSVDSAPLLRLVLTEPAHRLLSALEHGAATQPERFATLLCSGLGAAGAHALGRRLQEAQASSCATCAARAARQIESAFSCVGSSASDAQRAARERLLVLEGQFTEAAAASVLRETLGLGSLLASSGDRKRRREEAGE